MKGGKQKIGFACNAAAFGKDVVVVERIRSEFGRGISRGYAKIYTSKEKAVETEREHILKRNKLFEEKKKKGE